MWCEVFGGVAIRLCFDVEPAFLMGGFLVYGLLSLVGLCFDVV